MNLTLQQIGDWTGALLQGDGQVRVQSVSIDSRKVQAGGLFVAFMGAQVDGHDFAEAAKAQGAAALLVTRFIDCALPQLRVADATKALGLIAKHYLMTLPCQRIALTGSNGKTTLKNLTRSILTNVGSTYATEGNFNNEIGLPLSVLALREHHQFAVLEMGAGQPGDIDDLASLVRPDIAVVNNVMAAHLERLGSLTGVANEKSAIYRHLAPGGTAVLPIDDEFSDVFQTAAGQARKLTTSLERQADFSASAIQLHARGTRFTLQSPDGATEINLPLLGLHNVRNALAASALAFAAGASLTDIKSGLEQAHSAAGRLQAIPQPGGWFLLDDTYNANPGSVLAGINALAAIADHSCVVLGDMAELGSDAAELHADVGRHARELGIKRLLTLGELAAHAAHAAGPMGEAFTELDALIARLKQEISAGLYVLVKGSRSSRMERVLAGLGTHVQGAH